jgi:hypothetical protein
MLVHEIGQMTGKAILVLFPLFIVVKLNGALKKSETLIFLFAIGWFLYVIPMELRDFFKNNHLVLFWLGIIPSFGCAFALPLFGFIKNGITSDKSRVRLLISSFVTFILLMIYELMALNNNLGTFDWLDILMSILGLISINFIFNLMKLEMLFPTSASVSLVPVKRVKRSLKK